MKRIIVLSALAFFLASCSEPVPQDDPVKAETKVEAEKPIVTAPLPPVVVVETPKVKVTVGARIKAKTKAATSAVKKSMATAPRVKEDWERCLDKGDQWSNKQCITQAP